VSLSQVAASVCKTKHVTGKVTIGIITAEFGQCYTDNIYFRLRKGSETLFERHVQPKSMTYGRKNIEFTAKEQIVEFEFEFNKSDNGCSGRLLLYYEFQGKRWKEYFNSNFC
jgi:hypothetical protein